MNFIKATSALFGFDLTKDLFLQIDRSSTNIQNKFTEHVAKHNLSFLTKEEWQFRFDIFSAKDAELQKINAQEGNTYTVGHNQFSHLSQDEMKAFRGSLPKVFPDEYKNPDYPSNLKVADEVDWIAAGAVNEIQNQGQCGSSFAFAAAVAMEGLNFIKNGKLVKLSEQQLLDCDQKSYGCNGGAVGWAWDYSMTNPVMLETDYPYIGRQGVCNAQADKGQVSVKSYQGIKPRSVQALKESVAKGPTVVTVAGYSLRFQQYQGGIMNDKRCETEVDLALTAVGYGREGESEYLVVRNNWGAGWGENGYIRFELKDDDEGICGVMTMISAPIDLN